MPIQYPIHFSGVIFRGDNADHCIVSDKGLFLLQLPDIGLADENVHVSADPAVVVYQHFFQLGEISGQLFQRRTQHTALHPDLGHFAGELSE